MGPVPAYESLLLTPDFGIQSVRHATRVIVVVSGEVDLCTAPWLDEQLRRAQRLATEVIVDLEQIDFMDCAGLRVLMRASAKSAPGHFSVTPGPPLVQKLFKLTDATGLLHVIAPAQATDRPAALPAGQRRAQPS
jgi:anti-sigma B factor antagonist